jgi:molybdopterin synthase sulfur carrier subunit
VTVLYFAWIRQKVGLGEERLALPENVKTVADLAAFLAERGGGFAEVFADPKRIRAAINQEHSGFDVTIAESDEIAFFPPVTGG